MKMYIVKNPKDSVGIVMFGTEHKRPAEGVEHVHVLQKLDQVSGKAIRRMRDLVYGGMGELEQFVGTTLMAGGGLCPLKEALWTASRQFMVKRKQNRNEMRRVWLFTNDDDPCASIEGEQGRVQQVLKDQELSGVDVSLFNIGTGFRLSQFYQHALGLVGEDDVCVDSAGDHGYAHRHQLMRRKAHKKRSLGTVPFYLGGGNTGKYMGVQIFKTVAQAKQPAHVYLHSGHEPVVHRSMIINAKTGVTVQPVELQQYAEVLSSGERAYMTRQDIVQLKTGGCNRSHFRLLYCAPYHSLGLLDNYMSPYFIFPDDEQAKGSSLLFSQLMNALMERSLVMVAAMMRTRSSSPRLVAIMPQEESTALDGTVIQNNGMVVVPLPFSNEMRGAPLSLASACSGGFARPSSGAVQDATELISLTMPNEDLPVDYAALENPSLQNFYSVLQATALGEAEAEWKPHMDQLKPRVREENAYDIMEVCHDLITKTGCANVEAGSLKQAAGSKRVASSAAQGGVGGGGGGGAHIKPRTASDEQLNEWRALAAVGELDTLKLDALKKACGALSVAKSGTKKVLVDRIVEAVKQ